MRFNNAVGEAYRLRVTVAEAAQAKLKVGIREYFNAVM